MKYVAFLRGINVGGNSILPMAELKVLCVSLGFENVTTYIQSGNVIFESTLKEKELREKLMSALSQKMGKLIHVAVRTVNELEFILKNNPFAKENPAQVGVMLFAQRLQKDFLDSVSTTTGEDVRLGKREVYIYYPIGMGRSKLKLPKQANAGTVRNINTLQKILKT